ncbi:MAG: hypothetical protein WA323_12580 [Candidatus Nitrosopolaris sp.]
MLTQSEYFYVTYYSDSSTIISQQKPTNGGLLTMEVVDNKISAEQWIREHKQSGGFIQEVESFLIEYKRTAQLSRLKKDFGISYVPAVWCNSNNRINTPMNNAMPQIALKRNRHSVQEIQKARGKRYTNLQFKHTGQHQCQRLFNLPYFEHVSLKFLGGIVL